MIGRLFSGKKWVLPFHVLKILMKQSWKPDLRIEYILRIYTLKYMDIRHWFIFCKEIKNSLSKKSCRKGGLFFFFFTIHNIVNYLETHSP